MITNGLLSLHLHPSQLKMLESNHLLIDNAIHEILRFQAPVQLSTTSITTEEITISGTTIPKGQKVQPVLGAACRDPEVYENPNDFLIRRGIHHTLAFGFGAHYCLGYQLAILEGKAAILELLKRIPELSIKNLNAPQWKRSVSIRGLNELVATW
jgi:cytochrome P450